MFFDSLVGPPLQTNPSMGLYVSGLLMSSTDFKINSSGGGIAMFIRSRNDKGHQGETRRPGKKTSLSGRLSKILSMLLMALVSLLLFGCSAQPKAEAFAFVTSLSGGTVEVIAASEHKIMTSVWVGSGPCQVAITPDGSYIYVAHSGSEVSVLRTTDLSSVALISGISPVGIDITPDGAFAYVVNRESNAITVIRTSDYTVVTSVPVGKGPESIAISPDGAHAYVTLFRDNSVSIISTSDNAVVATVPVGRGPSGLAIAPDGTFAYVSNHPGNSVSVIRTSDHKVVATVPGGGSPSIAITPDGRFVYAPSWNDNNVRVIRTSDNTVVTTIPVGITPNGVAITPDGAYIYVTNYGSDTVSVIRAADNTVVASINLAKPCRVTIGLVPVSAPTSTK